LPFDYAVPENKLKSKNPEPLGTRLKDASTHRTNLFAFFTAHRKNLKKFSLRPHNAAADLFMSLKLWIGERQNSRTSKMPFTL